MSPAPVNNDPGSDRDEEAVHPGDVPVTNLILAMDSGSDDDGINEDENDDDMAPGNGYQLLGPGMDFNGPAGPGDSDDDDDDDENSHGDAVDCTQANPESPEIPNDLASHDTMNSGQTNGSHRHPMPHLQLPPPPENQELKEIRELWKTPRTELTPMAQDEADKIKTAMAGFSLPAGNLPQWATTVPETEWKSQLLLRLGSGAGIGRIGDPKTKKSAEETGSIPESTEASVTSSLDSNGNSELTAAAGNI